MLNKTTIIISIFIIATSFNLYATSNDTLYYDSIFLIKKKNNAVNISKEVLNNHIEQMKKILEFVDFYRMPDSSKRIVKDSLLKTVFEYDPFWYSYSCVNSFLFHFNKESNFVNSFFISKRLKDREMTIEEKNYYSNNSIIAPSYCKVTKEEAVGIAYNFLRKLLLIYKEEKTITDFDSISVSFGENYYVISLKSKQKTDVYDIRSVNIKVEAATSKIRSFSGDVISYSDLSYKPKISKNEAVEIVNNILKNKGNYYLVYAHLYNHKVVNNRMSWDVAVKKKGENNCFPYDIFIDSETGEVINNPIK